MLSRRPDTILRYEVGLKGESGGTALHKVELVYSISQPGVSISNVGVQDKLAQKIEQEALRRVGTGDELRFRLSVSGLFTVEVEPAQAGVPLIADSQRLEFVVRPKASQNGVKPSKQVEGALLSEVLYPSEEARKRFEDLVGLDEIKRRVLTMLSTLFSEEVARKWRIKHHPNAIALDLAQERYPVIVFAGAPGVGKTELAASIGDPLARALGVSVRAYRVGLQIRGGGLVGELGQNIAKLFEFAKARHQETGSLILLQVDEADAIGQKRDGIQPKHHEDDAGVNTLLQQIDGLRNTPGVALILTTNLSHSLDAALIGRSKAHWVNFPSPSLRVRRELLQRLLGSVLSSHDLRTLAWATDGFSPRDLVELFHSARIEAQSKDASLTKDLLLRHARLLSHVHGLRSTGRFVSAKEANPKPSHTAVPTKDATNNDTTGNANGANIPAADRTAGTGAQGRQRRTFLERARGLAVGLP
jgi:AAA+ superfamily predicted ATPase